MNGALALLLSFTLILYSSPSSLLCLALLLSCTFLLHSYATTPASPQLGMIWLGLIWLCLIWRFKKTRLRRLTKCNLLKPFFMTKFWRLLCHCLLRSYLPQRHKRHKCITPIWLNKLLAATNQAHASSYSNRLRLCARNKISKK